jgi:hypothetical protein
MLKVPFRNLKCRKSEDLTLRTLITTLHPPKRIGGVKTQVADYTRELIERSGLDAIG